MAATSATIASTTSAAAATMSYEYIYIYTHTPGMSSGSQGGMTTGYSYGDRQQVKAHSIRRSLLTLGHVSDTQAAGRAAVRRRIGRSSALCLRW